MSLQIKREIVTYKQRVLLALIDTLSQQDRSSKFQIEKNLFLLKKEEDLDNDVKFYNFYPYNYGPFSNVSYFDLNVLISKGYIFEEKKQFRITEKAIKYLESLNPLLHDKIRKTTTRFTSDKEIKEYVYEKYPEYTVKSKTLRIQPTINDSALYSIGYEGKDIDLFLDILIRNNISFLIDIRHNPFSMNFSFTKSKLEKSLKNVGIEYRHIPELGISGDKRKDLTTTQDYAAIFEEYNNSLPKKQSFVDTIIALGKEKRVAFMCFEHNKNNCHRGVLSHYLLHQNILVEHL
jgi:uncharacterized protein (DUF488 family)